MTETPNNPTNQGSGTNGPGDGNRRLGDAAEMSGPSPEGGQEQVVHHQARRKRGAMQPVKMQPKMESFIDVIFQLLIYFVVTASFAPGEGIITAKLPQGSGTGDPLEPPKAPLNIVIADAGRFDYRLSVADRGVADFKELTQILKELQYDPQNQRGGQYKPDDPVVIRPSGMVRWQHVVNAFNAAVTARYKNIAFAQAQEQPDG